MQRSALDAEVRRSVNEKLEKSGEKERCGLAFRWHAMLPCVFNHNCDAWDLPLQIERVAATETRGERLARPAEGALQGERKQKRAQNACKFKARAKHRGDSGWACTQLLQPLICASPRIFVSQTVLREKGLEAIRCRHQQQQTTNPQQQTPNPQQQTLNPKPQTLNSQQQTPNPQQQTPNP